MHLRRAHLVGVRNDAGVEQGGGLERILLAEIGADQVRLVVADRTGRNHQAVYLVETAQQHIFDAAMPIRQAGDDTRQFFAYFGLVEIKHAVGQALRPRAFRAVRWRRIIGRNKRLNHYARGVGAQLDRQVIKGQDGNHFTLDRRESGEKVESRQGRKSTRLRQSRSPNAIGVCGEAGQVRNLLST